MHPTWFLALLACPVAPQSLTPASSPLGSLEARSDSEGAPAAVGQESEVDADTRADANTREAARILHLRDGGILRGRTRWNGSSWELREGRDAWRALPLESVTRVVLEREALERRRQLLAKVERNDSTQRVIAADWMLREGLADEALAELETVLGDEPDHPGALRVLTSPPVPLAAPGSSSTAPLDAMRSASVRPRVVQELAIVALGRRADAEAVDAALAKALHSPATRMRSFAALALRRLRPGAQAKELLGRAVLDSSAQVREEAALALRAVGEEGLILPIVRALRSEHTSVRSNAADALGAMGFAAAVEPLINRLSSVSAPQSGGGGWQAPAANIFVGRQVAYVQDYDVEVAQFASIADPQVNVALEGSVLDVRVIGVQQFSVATESRRIRGALARLTGANPGATNRAWLDWWEQNKAQFGVRTPPRKGPVSTGGAPARS